MYPRCYQFNDILILAARSHSSVFRPSPHLLVTPLFNSLIYCNLPQASLRVSPALIPQCQQLLKTSYEFLTSPPYNSGSPLVMAADDWSLRAAIVDDWSLRAANVERCNCSPVVTVLYYIPVHSSHQDQNSHNCIADFVTIHLAFIQMGFI